MSQKNSAAIADKMLLALNSDTITEYAQNNIKLVNMLSGQNI
jgi:hypothetical protein